MFLIGANFRKARSKKDKEKQGVVYYRIVIPKSSGGGPEERVVNSSVRGADDGVLDLEREIIVGDLRLLYCVVERLEDAGKGFTIDDVAEGFRKALAGDVSMKNVIAKAKTDFPLRRDIVSVGRKYKNEFRYVGPTPASENWSVTPTFSSPDRAVGFTGYLSALLQEPGNGLGPSYRQKINNLRSSLRNFSGGDSIGFEKIDGRFVADYASWLKSTGIAETTRAFYLGILRTVLGKAYADGLILPCHDWFRGLNTKASREAGKRDKEVPDRELLLKIKHLSIEDAPRLSLYRDMFMFGFYCGGMELVDIANLTWQNVIGENLVYRRRLVGVEKKVRLGSQAMELINSHKSEGSDRLFPLLDENGNTLFVTERNYVASGMKEIGKMAGFPQLTFSMNIDAYNRLLSTVNIAELLLGD